MIGLPGGQIKMTLRGRDTFLFPSSQEVPRLRHRSLRGFLGWYGALQGPLTRLIWLELHSIKDTVRCSTPSAIVSGPRQEQLSQTLRLCVKRPDLILVFPCHPLHVRLAPLL